MAAAQQLVHQFSWVVLLPRFTPRCLLPCLPRSGRCGPNASAPQPGCSDVPTPDGYSCQQQKGEQTVGQRGLVCGKASPKALCMAAFGFAWRRLAAVCPQ